MIFRILAGVFFFGVAILLAVLGVMRGLYRAAIFSPPEVPADSAATDLLDSRRDKVCESRK